MAVGLSSVSAPGPHASLPAPPACTRLPFNTSCGNGTKSEKFLWQPPLFSLTGIIYVRNLTPVSVFVFGFGPSASSLSEFPCPVLYSWPTRPCLSFF